MRLAVLGPVTLVRDDGVEVPITPRQAREVITMLALEHPRPSSLDALAARLWDDPPPAAAKPANTPNTGSSAKPLPDPTPPYDQPKRAVVRPRRRRPRGTPEKPLDTKRTRSVALRYVSPRTRCRQERPTKGDKPRRERSFRTRASRRWPRAVWRVPSHGCWQPCGSSRSRGIASGSMPSRARPRPKRRCRPEHLGSRPSP